MEQTLETIQQQLLELKALVAAPPTPPYLTPQQAADYLGIGYSTLKRYTKELPHRKQFGRVYFYPAELDSYLRNSPQLGKRL